MAQSISGKVLCRMNCGSLNSKDDFEKSVFFLLLRHDEFELERTKLSASNETHCTCTRCYYGNDNYRCEFTEFKL